MVSDSELTTALALCMWVLGFVVYAALAFVPAPYGKYVSHARGHYGPLLDGRLAWVVQEAPAFLLVARAWLVAAAADPGGPMTRVNARTLLLAAFLAHYAHRTFVYPLRLRGAKPTPLLVCAMAAAFCVANGVLQGTYLTRVAADDDVSPRFVAGMLAFALGAAINVHSDGILRNLRAPGETGYKIPRGGAFDYVSGANFAGEIVEWCGWAVAGNNLPAAAFAFFTFANVAPRAQQHHAFYRRTFGTAYPAQRAAVIPFVL